MRRGLLSVAILTFALAASGAEQPTLTELYERVDPAVVEIATIQETITNHRRS